MFPPAINGSLETKVRNYLIYSYQNGYHLDTFFTKKDQIIMFERLLSCHANFKQEWENGEYYIPEDPAHTMYFSTYIKKQSTVKKLSRKIDRFIYNKKLTKGAKNLLEAYMIKNSQDFLKESSERNINTKMEEMFCGIFEKIRTRKESYIAKKLPQDLVNEIKKYASPGGTKRKRKTNNKTRKNIHP